MKLYDIFNEDEVVDEVRMDPSSFATAIEQGDPATPIDPIRYTGCSTTITETLAITPCRTHSCRPTILWCNITSNSWCNRPTQI